MTEEFFAGIDIGSTTSKAVIIDGHENIKAFELIDTGFNRDKSGQEVYQKALNSQGLIKEKVKCIIATGYGRRALSIADDVVPEIVCHAKGTVALHPGIRTIIDIGGQDSKVIELNDQGMILKFEMNDKCAAGTGRFFEVLTDRLLNTHMDELGPLALQSQNPCTISSMCTIFAETEIISFLSEGVPKEDIAMGMNLSIAKRVIAMGKAGRIQYQEPIIFSGGVANNIGATKAFSEILGKPVEALKDPQITGALGAALTAIHNFRKQ